MKDKIELTEEMVNTLDNPPKANDAFKVAAKKYKGEDIKMADGSVLSVPDGATHWLGDCFAKWVDNNRIAIIGNYQGAVWRTTNKAMPRNAIGFSELNQLREKQKLTQQVERLKFSLDDRDCYIADADADMKNEALTKQVAELRAALRSIKEHQKVVAPSGYEFSTVWSLANKALKESE